MAGHITEPDMVLCDGHLTNKLSRFSRILFRRVYKEAISSKEMLPENWESFKRFFFFQ